MAEITENEVRERARKLLADADATDQLAFRGDQFDAGLAVVHFPVGKGGLGASRKLQSVINEELVSGGVRFHDLIVNPIGIGMGMPVTLTYASEGQQHRLLRPCFTGEEIWCQMFSEPGAGSDVAGLSSRAVRDGDEWVVNGQKVWTTLAHVAKWAMLVARTDPEQPKHKGLTYFLLDMQADGVEVRPLYQITGEAEFNEVFLTDVRIPDANVLGGVGNGWAAAVTTLMNERVALGGGVPARGSGQIAMLVDVWQKRSDRLSASEETALRDEVVRRWIEAETLRLTNYRARVNAKDGNPGPEGSVGKLISAEMNQRIFETALKILGPEAMILDGGYTKERSASAPQRGPSVQRSFLRSRANTIEGGTSEIMRNILGERVLGLPGEPRVDKNVAWSDVPRN